MVFVLISGPGSQDEFKLLLLVDIDGEAERELQVEAGTDWSGEISAELR